MLSITNEQICHLLIGFVFFIVLYIFFYHKKGKNKNLTGYINALKSCLGYFIVLFFMIFGWWIAKEAIIQKKYIGLLLPLIWLIICYSMLKEALKQDFNINISVVNKKRNSHYTKEINMNIEKNVMLFGQLFLIFVLLIFVFVIFSIIVTEFNSLKFYNLFMLLIVGFIFLILALIFIRVLYFNIIGFKKKVSLNIENLFSLFVMLFGILFFIVGLKPIIDYKEKENSWIEVEGNYIGYEQDNSYSNKQRIMYFIIYSYEINGQAYIIKTDFSTSKLFLPNHGDKRLILYDPNNPTKAIIKYGIFDFILIFFGFLVVCVGICRTSYFNQKKDFNK